MDWLLRLIGRKAELKLILGALRAALATPTYHPSIIKYAKRALELVDPSSDPATWADIRARLGRSLLWNSSGPKGEQIEEAIQCFLDALPRLSPLGNAENLGGLYVESLLGLAYFFRQYESRADNIEKSIAIFERLVRDADKAPEVSHWRLVVNLASADGERIRGDQTENRERGLQLVAPLCDWPLELAKEDPDLVVGMMEPEDTIPVETLCALGGEYLGRLRGNRFDNYKKALECYDLAMTLAVRRTAVNRSEILQPFIIAAHMGLMIGGREHPRRTREMLLRTASRDQEAIRAVRPMYADLSVALLVQTGLTLLEAIDIAEDLPSVQFVEAQKRPGMVAHNAMLCFEQARVFATERDVTRACQALVGMAGCCEALFSLGAGEEYRQRAAEHFRDALSSLVPEREPRLYSDAMNKYADFRLRQREFLQAEALYRESLAQGEQRARETFSFSGRYAERSSFSEVYGSLAYCLLERRVIEEAVGVLESGKQQMLLQAMAEDNLDLTRLPADQAGEIAFFRQRVKELSFQIEFYSRDTPDQLYVEAATKLGQANNILHGLLASAGLTPATADWHRGWGALGDNSTVLLPVVGDLGTTVIEIEKHGNDRSYHVFRVPELTKKSLARLLGKGLWRGDGELQAICLDYDATEAGPIRPLVRAIIDRTDRSENVVLSLQGGLQVLPIHAFCVEKAPDAPCLMDRHAVSFLPSLSLLGFLENRVACEGKALLVTTSNVPGGIRELMAVEGVLRRHGVEMTILVDSDATLANVIAAMQESAYIHFACHGAFAWGKGPLTSSLALWREERLTVNDIASGPQLAKAPIAVLAACESGIVDSRVSANEFVGLPSALLRAGARGVVSSLWKVDGSATCLLMERFYENLMSRVPPGEALREAQIWLRSLSDIGLRQLLFANREWDRAKHREVTIPSGDEPFPSNFRHGLFWGAFRYEGV